MVFLNPTVLFGLLAASIPVILHFLNLRKIKKVEFSSLAFLKELQKSKIKKIKFKQWLLLLLRILIIVFLVSSFARPTIESIGINGTGSIAKTTAIFILDDSYSMSVVDENGSHFNHAKSIISNLLSTFNDGDELKLILTSDPEIIVDFNNYNLSSKLIPSFDPSYVSRPLVSAINTASSIITGSQNLNKEVYILSDFQTTTSSLNGKNSENNIQAFSENTKLYLFEFNCDEVNNLAVSDLISDNQIFELNKEISILASVTNFADSEFNDVLISVFLNGEITAKKNFSIRPGTTDLLSNKTTLKQTGVIELLAELEDDEIEHDNRAFNTLTVTEKVKILVLEENPADSKYIDFALTTSSQGIFQVTKSSISKFNSTELNSYDCVFLFESSNYSNLNRLNEYVKNGGRIVIIPGSDSKGGSFNSFLSEFEITGYGTRQNLSNENQFNSFEDIDFKHPIFANLFKDSKEIQIESPKINSFIKNSQTGKGVNIIALLDGSSFLTEYYSGDGRIFIFSVAPTLSWSDFPIKSIFAPLINRIVYYLTSNRNSAANYFAGDKIEIDISNVNTSQIKIQKPGKVEEYFNLDTNIKSNYLKYGNTNEIGIYKFYSGKELLEAVAVNINLIESDLDQFSPAEFEQILLDNGFKGQIINLDKLNYEKEIKQARYGFEFWKLFLIIALILALLEMLLSRSAKKDLTEINE